MELPDAIATRRAYRAMSDKPIPFDVAQRVLETATLAPSCFNNQPWRFVAATGGALDAVKASLPDGNKWATRAPLIVAVATKPSLDCRLDDGRDYALFDTGAAAMCMILQATHEGLYAHPIAGFAPKKIRTALGIPDDFVVIALVVIGYPGNDDLLAEWQKERENGPRERKPAGEVLYRDHWPDK